MVTFEDDSKQLEPYIWEGRTDPFTCLLAPGVFTPTATSKELAASLKIESGEVAIDVGCGSGVLSFVAARLGAARVYGCDISKVSIHIARLNTRNLGLAGQTEFRQGNLFEPVQDIKADVIIGDVSGIPDAVAEATGWFSGGPTGSELPVAMLESLGECLKPGGRMYLATGTIQAQDRILVAAGRVFNRMVKIRERQFPLPPAASPNASPMINQLVKEGVIKLERRGSRWLWQLTIWCCLRAEHKKLTFPHSIAFRGNALSPTR